MADGPADPANHLVFTAHFFGQSVQTGSISVGNDFFADEGYYFVTFNYPGLWQSGFSFSVKNSISAGIAVLQFIHGQYPDYPIFVFGYSFGGPVSLNCVKEVNFIQKLFLRAPVPIVGKATMQSLEAWEGMQSYLNDLISQGLIKVDEPVWTAEDHDRMNKELAIGTTLDSICNKLPIKVIAGKNDGILAIEIVKKIYQTKTIFEAWDNLPHVIADADLLLQIKRSIINFLKE